jgi:CBS domain-containing protein
MQETIGKYASRPVVAVESEATVMDALILMSEKQISCIIVLSRSEPIGILTERDIVFAANWVLGQQELLVKDVMNKPVLTASEDMTIEQAYSVFCQHNIRHLVILDDQLNMVGIFTQTDLVRSLKDKAFNGMSDVIELMSSKVLDITADVPARYALSLMARRAVSCIVIVNDESQPIGIFTERDVVRCIAEGIDLNETGIGDVMSSSVVTTSMTSAPEDTIGLMLKNSIRRLLVVDDQGGMAGILTQTDIGRVLDKKPEHFGDILDASVAGA